MGEERVITPDLPAGHPRQSGQRGPGVGQPAGTRDQVRGVRGMSGTEGVDAAVEQAGPAPAPATLGATRDHDAGLATTPGTVPGVDGGRAEVRVRQPGLGRLQGCQQPSSRRGCRQRPATVGVRVGQDLTTRVPAKVSCQPTLLDDCEIVTAM